MKATIHDIDKVVRIILAIVLAILIFTGIISGIAATILAVVVTLLVITVFINSCPIYHFIGISTKKKTIQSQNK